MAESRELHAARKEVYGTLGRALWRFRWRTLAALALLLVAKLLMVAVPVVLKLVVDRFSQTPDLLVLPVFLLVGYALLRFAGGLFTELRDLVFVRVTQTTVADFNVRLFEHLHRLGARFHASRQTGVLARDVERGTGGLAFLLGTALFTLLPTLVEIVSVVAILVAGYSVWFAAIVAVTFVLYAIVTVVFTARRMKYQRQMNEYDSAAGGRLVDSLLNYENVKFHNSEAAETRRLRDTLSKWVEVGIENQRALSALHVAQSAIIALGVAAVMLLAGQEVLAARMSVGDLVLVNAYIIQICLPLSALGLVFRQAREALVNAERVCALLQIPPEVDDSQELPDLQLTRGEVRFENVSFGYEPARQILWDVSFQVPPGATVAVVGGTGSGKSTLGRLLFRFYEAQSGRILIDGQDVTGVSPTSLRAALGIVPQDTLLFNETIAYNIGYGRPGASMADIIDAARGARVHDFIQSLPAQYETMVGERGVKLSGGERQRISIARTLLKNPPILLFDEATSALDTRTERAIQEELDRISQGRTTLVIAHRLSTVVDADQIIVLEHGRVVERGTHKELLVANGVYAQMWNLQRQQNELEQAGARPQPRVFNMTTLVAGVLDILRPSIEDKYLNLYTQLDLQQGRVLGDPGLIRQVVWDLCTNAINVTPAGGRIGLSLTRHGAAARLSVTDERPAPSEAVVQVPQEDIEPAGVIPEIPHLDIAEAAANAEMAGATLGGGPIASAVTPALESGVPGMPAAAGTGHTYWIELPLSERAPSTKAPPAQASAAEGALVDGASAEGAVAGTTAVAQPLHGLSVALVDGEPASRQKLGAAMQERGAVVQAFDTGRALLATLGDTAQEAWPQLLVCDATLGDMDGYAVVTSVRALEAQRGVGLSRRIPAIALSRHEPDEGRLRALLAGFQAHVDKPVELDALIDRMREVARPHQRS